MTGDPTTPPSVLAEGWLRPLGATGLTVSAVAAGGGPIGSMPEAFGYDVPAEQAITLVSALELARATVVTPIRLGLLGAAGTAPQAVRRPAGRETRVRQRASAAPRLLSRRRG